MNYKSQLKGWAVDRVIELHKANTHGDPLSLPELCSMADELSDYAYVPREDLESTAKELFELVRNAPANQSSVDALLGTLEHIKADRIRDGLEIVEKTDEL